MNNSNSDLKSKMLQMFATWPSAFYSVSLSCGQVTMETCPVNATMDGIGKILLFKGNVNVGRVVRNEEVQMKKKRKA